MANDEENFIPTYNSVIEDKHGMFINYLVVFERLNAALRMTGHANDYNKYYCPASRPERNIIYDAFITEAQAFSDEVLLQN